MMKSKKEQLSRRAKVVELIKRQPGITSAEIAEKLGLDSSTKVSTSIWPEVKSGRVLVERISRNGKTMNSHYLPDQVPPDAVERVQQKIVDASSVIPIAKSSDTRSSVFDNKPRRTLRKLGATKHLPHGQPSTVSAVTSSLQIGPVGFACAVTHDGRLVLIREGQIQFSLTDYEATMLQSYLVKRAAANFFVSMA
ncbi:winged helix-turn-helix domain-containing protein [Burkholderia alba]|uniref:winged helix-turn-helix domain-containing protein n=1 Tax=Burkholderia alba TaxID=2683677 RepID=UPI002B054804|nr:winged helix-turn-helix domain-containing protein [Burkholderia alba]